MNEKGYLRVAIQKANARGVSADEILDAIITTIEGLGVDNRSKKEIFEDNLMWEITNVMHEIGVPANINGYLYLRYAIEYCIKNRVSSVMKELYPIVAKEYGTTAQSVERAIRHAIEIAWGRENADVVEKYFRGTISPEQGKPSNSQFIFMIADYFKVKYRKF